MDDCFPRPLKDEFSTVLNSNWIELKKRTKGDH